MKALKGTPEEKALTQRYVAQLDQQETRVAAIRTEIEALQRKVDAAQAELNRIVQSLSFDEKL